MYVQQLKFLFKVIIYKFAINNEHFIKRIIEGALHPGQQIQ